MSVCLVSCLNVVFLPLQVEKMGDELQMIVSEPNFERTCICSFHQSSLRFPALGLEWVRFGHRR